MGKRYKQRGLSPKSKLIDVIEDLCAHPNCAEYVSTKLVRHFVTDEVTPDMVQPVIDAWRETDGHLPAVYKALDDARAAEQRGDTTGARLQLQAALPAW